MKMKTYTIHQISELTNLSLFEINSLRKSGLITHTQISTKKYQYYDTTLTEISNINGFEKLHIMFTKKKFRENNLNFQTLSSEIKEDLLKILDYGITSGERYDAIPIMLSSSTTLENNLFERYKRYCEVQQNTETFYRLKFGDEEGIEKFNSVGSSRGKGNTLEGQIAKYGLEEGTRRHTEMNSKRAHTIENFIKKYGEEKGREMFEHTMSKKGVSLDVFKNKYGEELGLQRYNEWKEKCVSTEENFIKRHGEKLGKQKWEEFKEKSKSTKDNFIRRHGKTLGTEKWKNYKENYGWAKASKQSLEIFEPLTEFLTSIKIDFNDIFYGVENSFEYKIESNDRLYSYDYTILPLKLIFEFNGNHVHPSKELLGDKWSSWRNAWTGEDADTRHCQDMEKISIAENEGFTVIEIWDYENKDDVLAKCKNLVLERI